MKRLVLFLRATLLGVAFSTLLHASSFEGRIHLRLIEGVQHPEDMVYTVKGQRVRFDLPSDLTPKDGLMGAIIFDYAKNERLVLMELKGKKTLTRQPMLPGAFVVTPGKGSQAPQATGRTDTIAGYPVKEYTGPGDNPGETNELWMAVGLGRFAFPGLQTKPGAGNLNPGWEKFATDGGFFPLRVKIRGPKNRERTIFEVTGIEAIAISDSAFSTAGYTPVQMP